MTGLTVLGVVTGIVRTIIALLDYQAKKAKEQAKAAAQAIKHCHARPTRSARPVVLRINQKEWTR